MVPSYQPETAYRIFMRAMFNLDIATGTRALSDELRTEGPRSTWAIKNEVLPAPDPVCYTLDPASRCEEEVYEMVKNGTAVVRDYLVVGKENDGEDGENTAGQGSIEDGHRIVEGTERFVADGGQKVLAPPVSL